MRLRISISIRGCVCPYVCLLTLRKNRRKRQYELVVLITSETHLITRSGLLNATTYLYKRSCLSVLVSFACFILTIKNHCFWCWIVCKAHQKQTYVEWQWNVVASDLSPRCLLPLVLPRISLHCARKMMSRCDLAYLLRYYQLIAPIILPSFLYLRKT